MARISLVKPVVLAISACFVFSAAAWADDGNTTDGLFGAAVPAEQLAQHRAGEAKLELNKMGLHANLEDNQSLNTLSGSNHITAGAFAGASGLPVAVQNSGNNVIIQNAFILNLDVK